MRKYITKQEKAQIYLSNRENLSIDDLRVIQKRILGMSELEALKQATPIDIITDMFNSYNKIFGQNKQGVNCSPCRREIWAEYKQLLPVINKIITNYGKEKED